MKKWIAKAIVQKIISYFPQRESINYLFQKYVTKGVLLTDAYFELKLVHARDHMAYYDKHKTTSLQDTHVVELGTGWYPIIPIALFLQGYAEVSSIDTQKWLTADRLITTLNKFVEWQDQGKLAAYTPNMLPDRWEALQKLHAHAAAHSLDSMCKQLQFTPIIADARNLPFEDQSIDFICSNNTFEHIPKPILSGILADFYRVLKRGGLMSHFIDMSDHFAHFDQSITIYNFLGFSEKAWKRIDNSIQPQNRMRFIDYKNMYHKLGIPITEEEFRPGDMDALNTINLHDEFADYNMEELAISHGYIVTKK